MAITISTREEFNDFKAYVADEKLSIRVCDKSDENYRIILSDGEAYTLPLPCGKWILEQTSPKSEPESPQAVDYFDNLIFGTDKTTNVVSIGVKDDTVHIFREINGNIEMTKKPMKYWVLSNVMPRDEFTLLDGNQHFRYMKEFDTEKGLKEALGRLYAAKADKYTCYDHAEAFMQMEGYTYFKGMNITDVSILSTDIETTSLSPEANGAKVLLISNTYRKLGVVTRKLFSLDDYKNELTMILEWCKWVREMDPTIILGHNIYAFDFPYLNSRLLITQQTQVYSEIANFKGLPLGRDDSELTISSKVSQYRYDGSQTYDYHKMNIFGREIVDTFFLAMKYDIGRNFVSYGLKSIIEQLGFEKEGRIKWDFEKNRPVDFFGKDPVLTDQFKTYCIDDGDDAIKLFDLMIPSFFYTNQTVPKTFTALLTSASGSWINNTMIRGYLGEKHSIPKPSETSSFEGAISFGIPGVYAEGFSMDFASLYPSIIRQFEIYDKVKDPLKIMLKIVEVLTLTRLKNKKLAKETGLQYYKDLEQSQKTVINSIYGFMGSTGLHFNSPENAALVTRYGRELLSAITKYCTGYPIEYWKSKIEN